MVFKYARVWSLAIWVDVLVQGKKGNVTFVFSFMTSLVKVIEKFICMAKISCKMIILLENLGLRHVCLMFWK
jgi:hypothetical protein